MKIKLFYNLVTKQHELIIASTYLIYIHILVNSIIYFNNGIIYKQAMIKNAELSIYLKRGNFKYSYKLLPKPIQS